MKITSKGQVTIPQELRDQFGFLPNTEVEFKISQNRLYLERIKNPQNRGKKFIQWMTGKGDVALTTDEIMKLTRNISKKDLRKKS